MVLAAHPCLASSRQVRLPQTWRTLERFVFPEVDRRLVVKGCDGRTDLISCMIREAKNGQDADRELIKGIVGSTAAGAIYCSAALQL